VGFGERERNVQLLAVLSLHESECLMRTAHPSVCPPVHVFSLCGVLSFLKADSWFDGKEI
jgi:hypothetical protein